ncbi:hypothetical protein D3C78_1683980 [compost metagenome]
MSSTMKSKRAESSLIWQPMVQFCSSGRSLSTAAYRKWLALCATVSRSRRSSSMVTVSGMPGSSLSSRGRSSAWTMCRMIPPDFPPLNPSMCSGVP